MPRLRPPDPAAPGENGDRVHGRRRAFLALAAALCAGTASFAQDASRRRPMLTGVNLAGAEFGDVGGMHGTAYRYPADEELDDLARRGFSVVRLPFRWERLQPRLNEGFDVVELERLDHVVAQAHARKVAVILDLHNYARWNDGVVGSESVPIPVFADVWARLAEHFRGQDGVVFGLMNEPHDMRTETWGKAAQAAVDAIRGAGACNRILVPGNAWTGAHSWRSGDYSMPNAVVMRRVTDPIGRSTFEFHQYLDSDWSGRAASCRPVGEVVAALAVATGWLEETGATGFLGEIGAGAGPQCLAGLSAMLDHVEAHPVWRGWTAWAAGAWWPKDYPLLLRSDEGKDTPQLALFTGRRAPADKAFVSASCR